jgi:muramoyltetrapeptide carboxypeptidase
MLKIPMEYISVVASLTSIPSRFENCKLVIDSLINQTDHIYLNLCSVYSRFNRFNRFDDNKKFDINNIGETLPICLLTEEPYKSKLTITFGEDFGPEQEPDDIMQACFQDLCLEQGEGTGWRMPVESAQKTVKVNNAVLWGGNLAVLTSLLGTPYFPWVKKGVLFLEDVGEHPYKIERMLTQLLNAGVLQNQKAIVFGQFTSYKLVPHDKGFKLQTVVDRLRSQLKIPVMTGLPFGHVSTKVLLPIGAKVDLATEGRDAFLVWGHI